MKRYLLFFLLLIAGAAGAQAPNIIYGKDVIISTRDTSSAELTILNNSRNVLGFFKNIGGGKGQYRLLTQADVTGLSDSLLARYTKTQADARFKAIGWFPAWSEVTSKPTNFSTTYALSNDMQDSILNRLRKSNNLSDLSNVSTARANLSVYSISNVDALLAGKLSVTITSPATGNLIRYNGTNWVNWSPNFLTSYTETDPIWSAASSNYWLGARVSDSLTAVQSRIQTKQPLLGYTPLQFSDSTTLLAGRWLPNRSLDTATALQARIQTKQNILVSGTNIKTVNGTNLLGSGDVTISSMIYPGAGIPVSTGTAWGTSITDNSSNWNTAFSWGNHASAGYSTASNTQTFTNKTWNGVAIADTYISSAATWNAKESALTFSTGLSRTGNTITSTITQYTDALARAAHSFTAGSGAYNSTTGVITIPTNTNQLTNGAGFITGNQTITLSGVVTGSGSTAITTSIAAGAITNAMLANGAVANLSGTNTGDNAPNSLYSGLVSNATHTGDATGSTALTVSGLRGVALPTLGASAGFLRYTGTGTNTWVFDNSTYLTSITSSNVTTALGYTPYNSTNPSGFLTSAVTSLLGTSNQITASASSGAVTLSLPSVVSVTESQASTFSVQSSGKIRFFGGGNQGRIEQGATTMNLVNENNTSIGMNINLSSGLVTASGGFSGSGANLTNIPYSALTGTPTIPTNANYVDLTTTQTVGGAKTYSSNLTISTSGNAGLFLNRAASSNSSYIQFGTQPSTNNWFLGTNPIGSNVNNFYLYNYNTASVAMNIDYSNNTANFLGNATVAGTLLATGQTTLNDKTIIVSNSGSYGQFQINAPAGGEATIVLGSTGSGQNSGGYTNAGVIGIGAYGNARDILVLGTGYAGGTMFLKSGSVGIATTSPGYKLDVNGDVGIATNAYVRNGVLNVSANSGTTYATQISTAYNYPYVDSYIDALGGTSYEGRLNFRTNSGGGAMSTRMTIFNSGALVAYGSITGNGASTVAGVATDAFKYKKEIISTGSLAGIFWEDRSNTVTLSTNWYGWYATGGNSYLYNGSGNIITISNSGAFTAANTIQTSAPTGYSATAWKLGNDPSSFSWASGTATMVNTSTVTLSSLATAYNDLVVKYNALYNTLTNSGKMLTVQVNGNVYTIPTISNGWQ